MKKINDIFHFNTLKNRHLMHVFVLCDDKNKTVDLLKLSKMRNKNTVEKKGRA